MGVYDVYGFTFELISEGADEACAEIDEDFLFFRREAVERPMAIALHQTDPPYENAPPKRAAVYTPRNISFSVGHKTYVDYSGRALAILDRDEPSLHIYSRHKSLLYEATYLFLLSRIGEYLDGRSMHRIHAMALSFRGRAVLALLPMGGGKSTLAAELLKSAEFSILSDDSPFVSADGMVHAFPLRLGLMPGSEMEVPKESRRMIDRMEFGPKILVNYSYFAHRVVANAKPGVVFLGERSLGAGCQIEPVGKVEQYQSIITNCVIGMGLYQGLEFVLRANTMELLGKSATAVSRLRNARALFRRSQVCRLILGRDHAVNGRTVTDYVRCHLSLGVSLFAVSLSRALFLSAS